MDDIRKILVHLEGGKVTVSAQAPSPFILAVREASLRAGYKSTTHDLCLHENSDPAKLFEWFNIEMDVYQVQDLTSVDY